MIDKLLEQRGIRYGEFSQNSFTSQYLKQTLTNKDLNFVQREALEMIFHKISRILNGDPNYIDSWEDIAGYATLAANEIKKHCDG